VARARSEFFKGKPARWRMAEPCALIIIFVTLGMILPLFFPCTPTQVLVWPCVIAMVCPCPGTCPACLPARPPARLPACPPACLPACLSSPSCRAKVVVASVSTPLLILLPYKWY
jgi:hypothetical protein